MREVRRPYLCERPLSNDLGTYRTVRAGVWPWLSRKVLKTFLTAKRVPSSLGISSANTYNLQTWLQSKLLHLYFNITNKDC